MFVDMPVSIVNKPEFIPYYFGSKWLNMSTLNIMMETWLVGCFELTGPLKHYFSLYRAVSQREGERKEK